MSKNVRDEIADYISTEFPLPIEDRIDCGLLADALLKRFPQLDSEKYISVERERVREISPLSSAGELIANPTDRILVISKEGKR